MRAAVLFEQGKPQRVEELDLEAPRRGEVLVHMAASGVCHSCLHAADGSWKGVPVPIVLGDEGAGVVEALGPDVTELAVGDHVILSWAPTFGRCHYCVIGRPNLCERRQPGRGVLPDGTTRMSLGGAPVYHYGHVATYASRTVVHESCAIRIDPALDRQVYRSFRKREINFADDRLPEFVDRGEMSLDRRNIPACETTGQRFGS